MTAARAPVQPGLSLPVAEGVHIGMPDSVYFDVPALGSTDLKALYWDPPTWWAQSEHNPSRRATRRQARRSGKDLGSALHVLVLQGDEAYRNAYAIEPDDGRSDWLRTRDDARAALRSIGVEIPKGDFSNATVNRLIRRHGLAHRYFDTARLDFEAAQRAGRPHVSEDEDRRLTYVARLIREHEFLGPALSGGVAELAVFWREADDPDTLMRAKFDYVRRRRMFDLKKIGNSRGRDTDSAIRSAIEQYDYDIQRRLYDTAWTKAAEFILAGQLHAWADDGQQRRVTTAERDQLAAIADAGAMQWCWIFVQLPVDDIGQERGAVIAPRWHHPDGAIWEAGGRKIATALETYRRFRDAFGLTQPWAVIEEAKELVDQDVRTQLKREMV